MDLVSKAYAKAGCKIEINSPAKPHMLACEKLTAFVGPITWEVKGNELQLTILGQILMFWSELEEVGSSWVIQCSSHDNMEAGFSNLENVCLVIIHR